MKLITLMLFLLLLASGSVVFAQNFSLYGVGHVSIDNVDDGKDSSFYTASNSSRLGLSGSYEFDSGAELFFQYESGVDLTGQGTNDGNGPASSGGQIFTKTRPSFVGLRGGFGEVLVGHMPALDQWANDYNLFADQVGDLGNLWEGSGVPGRIDNTIHYKSPTINSLDLALTYKPEEGSDGLDDLIVKVNYALGQTKFGVAYANIGRPGNLDSHTAMAFTFGYHADRFTVGGGYQAESDVAGQSGSDRDSYSFGASLKAGEKGTLKLQFSVSDGDGDNTKARQMALGYDYAFDDRTTLYLAYAAMDNDSAVNFSVNGKGHGDRVSPALGNDPRALSLGIIYKFDLGF